MNRCLFIRYALLGLVLLMLGCPSLTPENAVLESDDGTDAGDVFATSGLDINEARPPDPDPPKKTQCGSFVLACFDELSHLPVDLLAFRPSSRWPRTSLTWMLDKPLRDERMLFEDQTSQMATALAIWARATPLTFAFVETDADIVFSFEGENHGDPFPFDGKMGVRAHAFFPGTMRSGQVHLDAEEDWSLEPGDDNTHLLTVLVHEIGHALGLEHAAVSCEGTSGSGKIMAPCFRPGDGFSALAPEDVEAIQRVYGDPSGAITPRRAGVITPPFGQLANELNPDTDGDGIPDTLEVFVFDTDYSIVDTDGDAMSDFEEIFVAGTPPTDAGPDFDGDGLSDALEATIGTRPNKADTDGDGLNDGQELFFNTDPLLPDTDGDGVIDSLDEFPTFGGCLFGADCNENGTPDQCDIRDGRSSDENANGVPDECDECVDDKKCDDGQFCNGTEQCIDAACQDDVSPCGRGTVCDEGLQQCVVAP